MSESKALERLDQGQVWSDFCDRLKQAGEQIVAASPADPFDQAEGLRYLGRLTSHFLRSALDESDAAQALLSTSSPKIGLDNPDYVYAGARLSPKFEYKLCIEKNDAHLLGIGLFSGALGTPKGLQRDRYTTSSEIDFGPSGVAEVILSRKKHPGNWLEMGEETNSLTIRQTLLNRRKEIPARLTLERIDGGEAPRPLDPEQLVASLDRVGMMVGGIVGQFIPWTDSFREHPLEIREIDPKFLAVAQGDPNTTYHYTYWELQPGEVFHVVLEPPANFDYWNLQIGNHWLESLDYMHRDTHVNHETAVAEPDGTIHIVIADHDPNRPNWLDTAGHRRGALALRWVGADETPAPPRTWVDRD